ncbi:hypothetical protein EI94DRAFT_1259160 [Lactarius quietus]|nr:hypothetical protein EI94DRAFT_1259160 [Lactarius quietus]
MWRCSVHYHSTGSPARKPLSERRSLIDLILGAPLRRRQLYCMSARTASCICLANLSQRAGIDRYLSHKMSATARPNTDAVSEESAASVHRRPPSM